MPRGRCEAAEYFKRDRASPTKSRDQYKCNACAEAYAADPRGVAPPKDIDNRKTTMENHLRRCDFTAKFIKDKFATKRKLALIGGDSNASAAKIRVAEWSNDDQQTLESRLLEFQHQNLLPDGFIEKAATIRLLEFLRPGIASVLPSRRALGKRILIRHAKRCENDNKANLRERQLSTRGRVNFLSDVWKNIAKTHLLGCQLTLFGQVHTFDVVPVGSLHDGIAVARDLEGSLLSAVSQSWDVGSVVTDDAGQCKRARRVLALRWPRVAFLHCFAHDVNNLVKAVLNSSYRGVSDQASTAVNCMNGSSSKWLRRVRDVMDRMYGVDLAFITLCDTRWNSMQGCFASLLRVQSALQAFHASYRAALDFPASLQVRPDGKSPTGQKSDPLQIYVSYVHHTKNHHRFEPF